MNNNVKKFLSAIAERAIKTFAQTFIAVVGTGIVSDKSVVVPALLAAFSAAVLSVATSVASAKFGPHGPSLASESIDNTEVAGH
jgi:hypothetical protein